MWQNVNIDLGRGLSGRKKKKKRLVKEEEE